MSEYDEEYAEDFEVEPSMEDNDGAVSTIIPSDPRRESPTVSNVETRQIEAQRQKIPVTVDDRSEMDVAVHMVDGLLDLSISSVRTSPKRVSKSMTTKVVRANGTQSLRSRDSVTIISRTYTPPTTGADSKKSPLDEPSSLLFEKIPPRVSGKSQHDVETVSMSSASRFQQQAAFSTPPSSSARSNWVQYMSAEGWPYYYDTVSGQSSWDAPRQHIPDENDTFIKVHDEYQTNEGDSINGTRRFDKDWNSVQGYLAHGLNVISLVEQKAIQMRSQEVFSNQSRTSDSQDQHYHTQSRENYQNFETVSVSSLSDEDDTDQTKPSKRIAGGEYTQRTPEVVNMTRETWIECMTHDGKPYYFNQITKRVQWENPYYPKASLEKPSNGIQKSKIPRENSSISDAYRIKGYQELNRPATRHEDLADTENFYDIIDDDTGDGLPSVRKKSDKPPLPRKDSSRKKASSVVKGSGITSVEKRHLVGKSDKAKDGKIVIDSVKEKHLNVWNRFFENAMKMKQQSKGSDDSSLGKGNKISIPVVSWPSVPSIEDCEEMVRRALSIVEVEREPTEEEQELLDKCLMSTCYCGLADESLLLLQRGANAQCRDGSWRTPAHFACRAGDDTVLGVLIDYGADFEARDVNSYTPLHVASDHADGIHAMKYLLGSAVDPSLRNLFTGETAFHLCARNGLVEGCRLLMDYGATLTKNNFGKTPLDVAKEKRNKDDNVAAVVNLLKGMNSEKNDQSPLNKKSSRRKMAPFADLGLQVDTKEFENRHSPPFNEIIPDANAADNQDSNIDESKSGSNEQKVYLPAMLSGMAWLASLAILRYLSTFFAKLASSLSRLSNGNEHDDNNEIDNSDSEVSVGASAPPTDFELSQRGLGFRNSPVSRKSQSDDMLASLMAPPIRNYRPSLSLSKTASESASLFPTPADLRATSHVIDRPSLRGQLETVHDMRETWAKVPTDVSQAIASASATPKHLRRTITDVPDEVKLAIEMAKASVSRTPQKGGSSSIKSLV